MTNTKTIAKNTGWFGLENAINFAVNFFTSIAIARTLGPTKMGYIVYVTWIASVVGNLGGLGIPATTRKYMAEYLGQGDRATARYIYFRTFRLQAALASLATVALLIWVLGDAAGEYKLASALIVLSIWPLMVNSISAMANVATENLSANLPGSAAATFVFFAGIALTVVLKWGVIGIGASMVAMRLADFLVRVFPAMRRIYSWGKDGAHPPVDLAKRMTTFAWQSVTSMVAALVVWDRSEFFILKHLSADIRQISYYAVAFSLSERLLICAVVFGSAASTTIFAQFGRDKSKLPELSASSFRYLALSSIPIHFIASSLAFPALLLFYGNQYRGAAMVTTLAPLLCLPKAFYAPVQSLFQSMERQRYIIIITVLAGVSDWAVAWCLIPSYGAVGACVGSGVGQVVAVGLLWGTAVRLYKVRLPWLLIVKVVFSSALAALAAHYVTVLLPPLAGILCGGVASLLVLLVLYYFARVLQPTDRDRLRVITGLLPKRFAGPADKFLGLLIHPEVLSAA